MSTRVNRTRILFGTGVLGFTVALGIWGRSSSLSSASAAPPQAPSDNAPVATRQGADYSRQVVAYIYESVPITREEFGEYLIARCGVGERLNNMINRCIIEREAKARGIEVTAAEVEADFNETLKGINTKREDFVNTVLRPYHKTLYEWKEDVIKPRLMLVKMCRQRVTATEEDVNTAYEAYYGEKIHCRIIKWRKNEQALAVSVYPKIRDNDKEFDEVARHQFTSELAAKAGDLPPFGHYTTGNLDMEKAAFALRPGEISPLLETTDGYVVVKCIEHLPPTHAKTIDDARAELTEDIIKRKIDQVEIPRFFKELQQKANPKILLKDGSQQPEDLMRDVRKELTDTPSKPQ
jgi:hypothetical protein